MGNEQNNVEPWTMKSRVLSYLRYEGHLVGKSQQRAAAAVCVSGTTLRRQLLREGTNYRRLVDQVRIEIATANPGVGTARLAKKCGINQNSLGKWWKERFGGRYTLTHKSLDYGNTQT